MRAVTINVGGGPGNSAARGAAMTNWACEVARARPAIIFAQEVPDSWLSVWTDDHAGDYNVTLGVEPTWRMRSALITHRDLSITRLTEDDLPNLRYHGSYVAAACWENAPGGPVTLASVHASPTPAKPETYGWIGAKPRPRVGGGDPRYVSGRTWDSDYLLCTLGEMARESPVIAAGDFNESRTDDLYDDESTRQRGTWGTEYFKIAEEIGFTDCVHRSRGTELPTRGRLQLDHILASGRAAQIVADDPPQSIDAAWARSPAQPLSDHAALWFHLVDGR
jgi:hypothetical protein